MTGYERMLHDLHEHARVYNHNWNEVKAQMDMVYDYKSPNAWRKIWEKKCKNMATPDATINSTLSRVQYSLGDGDVQSSERVIPLLDEQLHDKRHILLAHKYNPDEWEIVNARHTYWDGQTKANGKETFYSSKITVKPKSTVDIQDIEQIFSRLKPVALPTMNFKKSPILKGRMLELTLADCHLNLLSWHGTTGQDYDLHIACDRVREVLYDTVERMGDERFDRIIIPVGNDFFNSDGAKGETTKGTPQDEDGRFGKCFEYGLNLYVEIVETMRRFTDSVEVVLVPGNHDRNASMMLSHAIKAYFRLCGDVVVDTVQMPRKYIEFGKVLLSLGHYDEDGRFPERLIANEASEAWGRTKYREAHGAHLHQEMVKEVGGVKFRRAPSIVVPSEWAHYKGYGCLQEHICYIYDYDKGLATTWHQTV